MGSTIFCRKTSPAQLLAMSMVMILSLLQAVPLSLSLRLEESLGSVVPTKYSAKPEFESKTTSFSSMTVDLVPFTYGKPNLTDEERVRLAVQSSKDRLKYFNYMINNGSIEFASDAVLTTPVYSNQGSYLMRISLGTPSRQFVAIADTGSDLVWVQCSPCTQCYQQPDPLFNPPQSSSYSATTCTNSLCNALPRRTCGPTCQYQYAYGDASTTQGVFSLETLGLGSQSFPNFAFGCGYRNQGTFEGTDGLVGLGRGPVSLVSQLGSQFGNVFSYCLVSFYSSASSPLIFGSANGPVFYTPLLRSAAGPSFYYVSLLQILVNGVSLGIPASTFQIDSVGSGGFILDSGTTLTQLQESAYTRLVNELQSLITYPRVDLSNIGLDLCFDLSRVTAVELPYLSFQFDGLLLNLPLMNTYLTVNSAGTVCLAIQNSGTDFGIYGNVQQQNYNIAYDLAGEQIGFAARNC